MAVILNKVLGTMGAALLVLSLGACLPGGSGAGSGAGRDGGKPGAGNVLTGDAIEVTPLDAAPPSEEATAKALPAPEETAASATAGGEAAMGNLPAAPVPVVDEPRKSEAWLACERRKGIWSNTGGGMNSCVFNTKDSGKACTSSKQCAGQCLARSGTCSPFEPLFGCNEILDDMGRRVTQCLQ